MKRKLNSVMCAVALFTFSFSHFMLSSCNEDGLGGDPATGNAGNDGDICFEIGFAGQTSAGGSQTRAATLSDFTSKWENGDEIGIFACTTGGTLAVQGNPIHNVKLTYSSAGGTWTPSEALWWPGSGDKLDFYAYYPYSASATNPQNIAFNVATDQSAAADHSKSDLLTAKTANKGKADGAVTLSFSHALAMVQVSIPGGKGWGAGVDGFNVTLRDVNPSAALNLNAISSTPGSEVTPAASGNDATSIMMYRLEQAGDANYGTSYTYRALIPAQDVAMGSILFLFDYEGQMLLHDGALTTEVTMMAGRAEKFERTMPATMIETVEIPAGTFTMGENGLPYARPHQVTLTKKFRMSKYPVTFAQYDAFCDATNRTKPNDSGWGRGNRPVVNVTWLDAKTYAGWIRGSLPTEAQWEYACRAGSTTAYSYGSTANGDYMWYSSNSSSKTHEVGTKRPNPWGLYDMHGNVYEWCNDWYEYGTDYAPGSAIDPKGPVSGFYNVLRGGCWNFNAQLCCSAYRHNDLSSSVSNRYGFRVVFPVP